MAWYVKHHLAGNRVLVAEQERRSAAAHLVMDLADLQPELLPASQAPGWIDVMRQGKANRGERLWKVTDAAHEEACQQSRSEEASERPTFDGKVCRFERILTAKLLQQ